jgi:hypothetical protein
VVIGSTSRAIEGQRNGGAFSVYACHRLAKIRYYYTYSMRPKISAGSVASGATGAGSAVGGSSSGSSDGGIRPWARARRSSFAPTWAIGSSSGGAGGAGEAQEFGAHLGDRVIGRHGVGAAGADPSFALIPV